MSDLPSNIAELVDAQKSLPFRPKWDDASDPRRWVFTVPLQVGEVIIGGFELRCRVSKQFIDRDALMQLEFARSQRDRIELWRCQWRPFETHTNKKWGPPGFELQQFISQSHHHPFAENYLPAENRMRPGSLPAALPIIPDPRGLSDFIAFCGECFRITNMQIVELPQATDDLFWKPND